MMYMMEHSEIINILNANALVSQDITRILQS